MLFNFIFNSTLRTNEIAQFWETCVDSTFQLLSDLNSFPAGAFIQGGFLISAVCFFPTGALIRGGTLIRVLRVV